MTITKRPLLVEIVGGPESGKTHFCVKIPNSLVVDLTPYAEGELIFYYNRPDKKDEDLYQHVTTFEQVIKTVRDLPDGITTVCFDGSPYLLGMIETYWCEEKNRKSMLQVEYGQAYDLINEKVIIPLKRIPCNIVFTSGQKEEFIGGFDENNKPKSIPSGKKVRWGIKPLESWRDVGLNLGYNEEGFRANKILKNRFIPRVIMVGTKQIFNPNYVTELKPEANWETLMSAICSLGSAMKREYIIQ